MKIIYTLSFLFLSFLGFSQSSNLGNWLIYIGKPFTTNLRIKNERQPRPSQPPRDMSFLCTAGVVAIGSGKRCRCGSRQNLRNSSVLILISMALAGHHFLTTHLGKINAAPQQSSRLWNGGWLQSIYGLTTSAPKNRSISLWDTPWAGQLPFIKM